MSRTQAEREVTNGVYYDKHSGGFVEIVDLDDTIGLCEPGFDEPYYTFDEDGIPYEEAVRYVNRDFESVSVEAQKHPKRVLNRALRIVSRNDTNEMASIPFQFAIDLRYARDSVTITED
jgi:hypothetical protein